MVAVTLPKILVCVPLSCEVDHTHTCTLKRMYAYTGSSPPGSLPLLVGWEREASVLSVMEVQTSHHSERAEVTGRCEREQDKQQSTAAASRTASCSVKSLARSSFQHLSFYGVGDFAAK